MSAHEAFEAAQATVAERRKELEGAQGDLEKARQAVTEAEAEHTRLQADRTRAAKSQPKGSGPSKTWLASVYALDQMEAELESLGAAVGAAEAAVRAASKALETAEVAAKVAERDSLRLKLTEIESAAMAEAERFVDALAEALAVQHEALCALSARHGEHPSFPNRVVGGNLGEGMAWGELRKRLALRRAELTRPRRPSDPPREYSGAISKRLARAAKKAPAAPAAPEPEVLP